MQRILLLPAITISVASAGTTSPVAPPPPPAISYDSPKRGFSFSLYAPLMGLEGDIGVAGLATHVDIPFEDILDNLDGGVSLAFQGNSGKWSLTGDFIWLKLSDAVPTPAGNYLAFRQQQIAGSLALGYSLFDNGRTTLDVLAGASVTRIEADLDFFTPPAVTRASGSRTWIDPFVGLRLRHQLGERWGIWLRGDYGGFGVSSDEYWQALAGITYRLGENTSLALAYRILSVDYHRGGFQYDTEMSGPNLGLVFKF